MTVMKLLPVALDKDEIESRALKLAEVCAKRSETEKERKESMSDFNQQIKSCNEDIKHLVESIQNGFQEEDVECDYRKNTETGLMETIRLDTNEVISTRPLEGSELNEEMDFQGKNLGDDSGNDNEDEGSEGNE